MKTIYEVTDKDTILLLIEELDRIATTTKRVASEVKRIMKPHYKGKVEVFVDTLPALFNGVTMGFIGPVVHDESKIDKLLFKTSLTTYGIVLTPKKNTKLGKELQAALAQVLGIYTFMSDPKIARYLGYKRALTFTWKNGAFFFFGYPGYRPVGANEVYPSDYNWAMGL